MKKFLCICCTLVATGLLTSSPSLAAPLTVGIAPQGSARIVLETYQPLRQYLEKILGYQVDIVTAPDVDEFARRGLAGAYDIAVTTSHQGRLLQTDAGYLPLLAYRADSLSLAIVADSGHVTKPADLNSMEVLGLGPTSQVTLWGQHWLKDHRVNARIRYLSASDSVAQLVAAGESAAGFTSLADYQKLPDRVRSRLRILARSPASPGRVYLLSPRLSAKRKEIESALWAFAATPEAKKHFDDDGLEGYRKLKLNELNVMDAYAAQVRKVLGRAP